METELSTLDKLWLEVKEINKRFFPDNHLMPILGGGKTKNPKMMFIFINPTARNISSNPNWQGLRAPFIGTKNIWRVFHQAELIDDHMINKINKSLNWSEEFAQEVYSHLAERGFYLTNIVKWTGKDSKLPNSEKIKLFLPILQEEIKIVRPKYIVTFGLIPSESLMQEKINLGEYFKKFQKKGKLAYFNLKIGSLNIKLIPCYFPVGRGNPKKAVEILRTVKKLI